MSSFKHLYLELTGTFPDLPVSQAKRFINRAQRDAFDAWNWSFLAGEGSLNIPDLLSNGTISVTQNSRLVVGNATAAAAWVAADSAFIPIDTRAIKVGVEQPYQILAWDGVDTLYLDRPFTGVTNATSTYSMYRPYYPPPDQDFQRWISIVDTTDAWNLIPGKKKEWLDWIDPQRSTIGGPAQFIAFFMKRPAETIPPFGVIPGETTITATDLFELWPAPTAAMSLLAYFKKHGAEMVNDTDESPFSDNCLIARGLYYAYRFVGVNQLRFAKTAGKVDWTAMKRDANADFLYELGNEMKKDDNINLASIIPQSRGWFPSSSWLQRHLTWQEYSQAYANSYVW